MAIPCPHCGTKGMRVESVTVRALLQDEFLGSVADEDYRFCSDAGCDTVYYSNGTTFTKAQLKVPVGVKETTGERPLCYCFGHSIASITEELRTKGSSDAPNDIRAKMKKPGCRCETENPSGSCCLGSVARGIQVAQAEIGIDTTAVPETGTLFKSPSHRGEVIAKVGTLVSAIMASACCWLPLVLLAAGVSGAGIASTLETYRPLFIFMTFSFLATAFYYTYRPKKATDGMGDVCCGPDRAEADDCCAPIAKGRLNFMAMNKVMLWIVTALAIVFLFFPSYVGVLLGTNGSSLATENMNAAMFKIDGMTCEGCASIVEKVVREVPGVLSVDVEYK